MNRRIFQVIDGVQKKVGEGFEVTSPMPGSRIRQLSPFLLLDHTGPMHVQPTDQPLGADSHPHRGFETVTIMYQGSLAHRDTAGYSGKLSPGDVQWMTAGAGLLHEERHEKEFARQGGILELIQLWVNVPKKDKMAPPRYQELRKDHIPVLPSTAQDKGTIRVISGTYEGVSSPALTFSPITILDIWQPKGAQLSLSLPAFYNTGIYVVKGQVRLHDNRVAQTKQLVVMGWDAEGIELSFEEGTTFLVLSGEPIEEPLATYGPFVMNNNQELLQAIEDFEQGRMGNFSD
ncbi:pirin family protein [Rufibacter latericius]|uniref:Pirin family protein n=1 Tax=Rufibacter latericius TaxID=2487040 RepID=A0A3M9MUC7_9BACT|nr:pirin family protein [Rufibacter latericius]RNI29120.1 pirin family protein [Rufibacter latericius]